MRDLPPYAVWAPLPEQVRLVLDGTVVAMRRSEGGWWVPATPVPDQARSYGYLLDDDPAVLPDPRSRRQPAGVHGLSRTVDPSAFAWTDQGWTGRPLAGAIIYEAHVGTFTPEGTFDAMAERLDHLVALGVDFLELMPVNAFNGVHNWGYDGVGWWAVHEPYGGPEGYQRLVDACHAAGIGVIQDVVYNHLGPSGNYLPRFGPYLSQGRANTWGSSVNLDGEDSAEVRAMVVENALMWFRDLHVDGLRLDAVHALVDASHPHLLTELSAAVDALAAHLRRPLLLVAESDLNDPVMITPREAGGHGMTGQWSDDFHHAVHAVLTGEDDGYYADFASLAALATVLDEGFLHAGTYSSFRGRAHGRPIDTGRTPAWRLVVCTQNHDQVGNRARGDRVTETLDERRLACAALLLLTAPFTPMLFQGEEWAASTPFQFFTSHPEPELARATAEGRLEEFARMGWDPAQVPDPQDEQTFLRSKLDWAEVGGGQHARMLERYRELVALRRSRPELTDPSFGRARVDGTLLELDRGRVRVLVNLGDAPVAADLRGRVLHRTTGTTGAGDTGASVLEPWSGVVLETEAEGELG